MVLGQYLLNDDQHVVVRNFLVGNQNNLTNNQVVPIYWYEHPPASTKLSSPKEEAFSRGGKVIIWF